jgi:adenylate cyclase
MSQSEGPLVLEAVRDPAWLARTTAPEHVGTPAQGAVLVDERMRTLAFLAVSLAATFSARAFRQWREHRVGSIRLTYPDRTIRVARGFSVLEASLINSIPHAHVCGGHGRCSTCRIRILGDMTGQPAPSAAEQAVLERVHAAPEVRLACQLRPTSNITLAPMLSPYATTVDAYRTGAAASSGIERYVVIMFVDMRGSSRLAERRLPFDTVFTINRFLNAVSSAVLSAGGEPNQVLGDGLLALFGMNEPPDAACRQAIAASVAIAERVDSLNSALAHALSSRSASESAFTQG